MVTYAYIKEWRKRNPDKMKQYAKTYRVRHREEENDRARKWRAKNPEKVREAQRNYWRGNYVMGRKKMLRQKYSLTPEQWDELFTAQGKVCAICGSEEPKSIHGWHTDHCHETLKVRGILCRQCNQGLGFFKDSVELIAAASAYLTRDA